MRFSFYTVSGFSFLEAIFEDGDSKRASRAEGHGTSIELKCPLVYFDSCYRDLHPDILGLVCLAIFYPFIGKKITFPQPVSLRLQESLSREIFRKEKHLEITNVDPSIPLYSGDGSSVLAYGGGVDSTAVRALFPDTFVVHEASVREGILVPDNTNLVVENLQKIGNGRLVKTNARYLSSPGGWHVWVGSIVTALLEANTRGASYIYSGTILGAAFLNNGARYFDRHASRKWHGPSGNYWQQLFWDVGLPLVQPLMGCSEILTLRASLKKFDLNEIFFCTAKSGGPCGTCAKCFRRRCIYEYISKEKQSYSGFYNNEVIASIESSPIYMGHIYSALMSDGWVPPSFADALLRSSLSGGSFALSYYQDSLDFMPPALKKTIKNVLEKEYKQMTDFEISELKKWNQIRDK